MERYSLVAALLVEALLLVWFAKQLWGVVLKRNVDTELTTHDNPAMAITLAGYFFGIFIALAGVPFGTPGSTNLLHVVTLTGNELERHEG